MSTRKSRPAEETGRPTDRSESGSSVARNLQQGGGAALPSECPAARLAERVDAHRRRRAQRAADRAELDRRRQHGLRIRHAVKVRRFTGGGGHRG